MRSTECLARALGKLLAFTYSCSIWEIFGCNEKVKERRKIEADKSDHVDKAFAETKDAIVI